MTGSIAKMAQAARAAYAAHIGYSQTKRWTFFDPKTLELISWMDCDCSSLCGWIIKKAGYPINISGTFYTGNFKERAVDAGFTAVRFKSLSQVKAGCFILKPGEHVEFAITNSLWIGAYYNEKGKASGGKPGNQTGREVRLIKPHIRSGGWDWVLVPPKEKSTPVIDLTSISTYRSRLQFCLQEGNYTVFDQQVAKLTKKSSKEAAQWKVYKEFWKKEVNYYSATTDVYKVDVPETHIWVVLGSGLPTSGKMPSKMLRRLKVALKAWNLNPQTRILVSGGKGKPTKDNTEAKVMQNWLISNGVPKEKIILEENSSSTVGNARYSVPLLVKNGAKTFALISDYSHCRRGSLLFEAELINSKAYDLLQLQSVAFMDSKIPQKATYGNLCEFSKETASNLNCYSKFIALDYPTLKKGSKGKWVKELQRKLGGLTVDGDFGEKTEKVLKLYQASRKLEVDGVAGPITLRTLGVIVF